MKQLKELILFVAACTLIWACRAVDLSWNVETTRVQPAVFEAYHGETLNLEATMLKAGKPLADALQGEWKIYWQTNGMDQLWWSAPVSAPIGNKVSATFTGEMDPGANVVNGFIGCAGENYRAAFIIRFRHSPGATPNTLLKPVPILDLANTTVINAPWPTDETIAATVRRVIEEDGITGGGGGEVNKDEIVNYIDSYKIQPIREDIVAIGSRAANAESMINTHTMDDNPHGITPEKIGAAPASIAEDVQSAYAWSQNVYRYMTANTNAWFAGTNYVTNAQQAALRHKFAFEDGMDLSTVPCSMALWEIRDGEKVCVWDQRDWTSFYFAFKRQQILDELNPRIDDKADKVWSHHTATGIDNPADDTVWLDTPKVVLSAGYAWQRNQTTRGSFFTLVNRGGLTSVGSNRDGSYFEIKDDEGNSIFKISKTDSYMADADAASVHVEDSVTLTVNYPSTVQPVAYCCTDLAAGDFKEETDPDCPATVVWSHSGSTYTVRATPKVPDGKLFLFAKVKVEGQTKNEFAAPVEFTKIVIGGVTYTVGTATINGNTVLTLTR